MVKNNRLGILLASAMLATSCLIAPIVVSAEVLYSPPANLEIATGQTYTAIFPDSNFRSYIVSKTGASSENDIVNQADLDAITELDAVGFNIVSIEGIQYLNNLTSIYMNYNAISDLTPLAGLSKLQNLSLEHNQITDITPLSNLNSTFGNLNLGFNNITNIEALSHLENVQLLYLHRNQIVDMTPVTNLTVNTLTIWGNLIETVPSLANLDVDRLDLNRNSIVDPSFLSTLQGQVAIVELSGNHISNLSSLSQVTASIAELHISDQTISLPTIEVDGTYFQENIVKDINNQLVTITADGSGIVTNQGVTWSGLNTDGTMTYSWSAEYGPVLNMSKVYFGGAVYQPYQVVQTMNSEIVVKYVDEQGNELAQSETLTGEIGAPYNTVEKEISGWKLKATPINATGTFTEEPQTVTYVYTKDVVAGADVTVKYVDESGNEISATETLSGNVGEAYTSTQKTISGYTFKEVQ
ncbi:MucBP domain-containing protein, partial [Enterococcus faecalis]|nr:MucBP domain-containing protein [Enterococcus faecalis]